MADFGTAAAGFAEGFQSTFDPLGALTFKLKKEHNEKIADIEAKKLGVQMTEQFFDLVDEGDPAVLKGKFNAYTRNLGGDPNSPASRDFLKVLTDANSTTKDSLKTTITAALPYASGKEIQAAFETIMRNPDQMPQILDRIAATTKQRRLAVSRSLSAVPGGTEAETLRNTATTLRNQGLNDEAEKLEDQAMQLEEQPGKLAAQKGTLAQTQARTQLIRAATGFFDLKKQEKQARIERWQKDMPNIDKSGAMFDLLQINAGLDFEPTTAVGKNVMKIEDPTQRAEIAKSMFDEMQKIPFLEQMMGGGRSPSSPGGDETGILDFLLGK